MSNTETEFLEDLFSDADRLQALPSDSATVNGDGNGTTDHRKQLAVLVASGKSREFVGTRLTRDNVILKLTCKAVGMAVKIDDTEKLQNDLKDDYIIQQELASTAGLLSLKCGRLMAVVSVVLHIVDQMVIEPEKSHAPEDVEK